MYKYKKNIRSSLTLTLIMLVTIALINYKIDPYKHYGLNSLNPYFNNARYLNPGLVKHYDYNAIIAGASPTENFLTSEIDKILNLQSLKLSISGGTSFEHKKIMQLALEKEKAKTIILGLDIESYGGEINRLHPSVKSIPTYLYDDNLFNDYKYLLNFDVFYKENIRAVSSNIFGFNKKNTLISFAYYWADGVVFSKDLILKNLISDKSSISETKIDYKFKTLKENFDINTLELVKKYPNTKFIIFYPPYSIVGLKKLKIENQLKNYLLLKKHIFESTKQLTNVEIYDFQIAKNVTHNLDNYMDNNHYSNLINTWIIKQIKNKNYLVDEGNISTYLNLMREQVDEYDLTTLF